MCVWSLFCDVIDHCACQRRFSLSMHMDVKVSHRLVFWWRDQKLCSQSQFVGCADLPTVRQHGVEVSVSICNHFVVLN